MKKLIAIIITLLLVYSTAPLVFAEEGKYNTANDLRSSWKGDYPDYIGGVWCEGDYSQMVFGILDNEEGNKGKQEILKLIKDDSTVTFVYQKYSYKYLDKIMSEVQKYFDQDIGFNIASLQEVENRVSVHVDKTRINDEKTKAVVNELRDKYADAIYIVFDDETVELDADVMQLPKATTLLLVEQTHSGWISWCVVAIAVVFILLLVFGLVRKKKLSVLATNNGETIESGTKLSAKDVENILKKTAPTYPTDLDSKIMDEIEKE